MDDYTPQKDRLLGQYAQLKQDLQKRQLAIWRIYQESKGFPIAAERILKSIQRTKDIVNEVLLRFG